MSESTPARVTPSDPTALTTDQLRREMLMLRELLETRLSATEKASDVFAENISRVPTQLDKEVSKLLELMNERFVSLAKLIDEKEARWRDVEKRNHGAITTALDANKEAMEVLRERLSQMPHERAKDIDHLRGIQDEKFLSIQRQFLERDTRAEAAEQAQKEAAIATAKAAEVGVAAALQAQKEAAAKSETTFTKQIDNNQTLLASFKEAADDKIAALNKRVDSAEGRTSGAGSNLTTIMAGAAILVALLSATGILRIGGNGSGSGSGSGSGYPTPGPPGSVTVPIPNTPR